MSDEILLRSVEDGVLVLSINRPETRNAITPELADAIALQLERARHDESIRAVVIGGEGRAFCSGLDLSGVLGMLGDDLSPENKRAVTKRILGGPLHAALRALWEFPKPTVAAVSGAAAGIGLDLACCADLRVMSSDAKLAYSFVRRGLVPDGGTGHYLPRLVGLGRALELVLLGEPFDAATALQLGLANRVERPEEVRKVAVDLARRMGANAPLALAAAKARLKSHASFGDELSAAVELAAFGVASEDAMEGIAAFLEKREPRFSGR